MNKDNTGILFYNDKATGKQPNYSGHCMIGGVEYKVVGWDRKSERSTFISLVYEAKPKAPLKEEDIPF